jgi:hypothetical protein
MYYTRRKWVSGPERKNPGQCSGSMSQGGLVNMITKFWSSGRHDSLTAALEAASGLR